MDRQKTRFDRINGLIATHSDGPLWCSEHGSGGLNHINTNILTGPITTSYAPSAHSVCWDRRAPLGTTAFYYTTREKSGGGDLVRMSAAGPPAFWVWEPKRISIPRDGVRRIDRIVCTPSGHVILSQCAFGLHVPAWFYVFDPKTSRLERLAGVEADAWAPFLLIDSSRVLATIRTDAQTKTRQIVTFSLSAEYFL